MPVEGLPSTLEAFLNSMLHVNTLSSFKIDSRGDNTAIVLRFTGQPCQSANTYRKKPPSQIQRDRNRAQQRRLTLHSQASQTFDSSATGTLSTRYSADSCSTPASCERDCQCQTHSKDDTFLDPHKNNSGTNTDCAREDGDSATVAEGVVSHTDRSRAGEDDSSATDSGDSNTGDSPSEPAGTFTEAQASVTEQLRDEDTRVTWKT